MHKSACLPLAVWYGSPTVACPWISASSWPWFQTVPEIHVCVFSLRLTCVLHNDLWLHMLGCSGASLEWSVIVCKVCFITYSVLSRLENNTIETFISNCIIFGSPVWAVDIGCSECCLSVSVCVCASLNVNQGGTNCYRCTQRLVILHIQTY